MAARGNQEMATKLLLKNGANLEAEDRNGMNPLLFAAAHGNETIVDLLLEKGADIESRDTIYEWTPLFWAAAMDKITTTKLLLNKGANLEAPEHGLTPVFVAASYGHEMIVKLLLDAGANPHSINAFPSADKSPSFKDLQNYQHATVRSYLHKWSVNYDAPEFSTISTVGGRIRKKQRNAFR